MITIQQHDTAIIAAIFGVFQLADFNELEADISARCLAEARTPVDLLVDLREMASFTVDVAWQELRYSRKHAHDFHRIAVVADSNWTIWSSWLARAFVDAEFKVFEDYDAALAWLELEGSPALLTLASAAQLARHLDEWVIFDCRHNLQDPSAGRAAYEAGHLPGAHFLHLDYDLAGPVTGTNGRHPLPDPEALARRLGELGVHQQTQVVVYDDAGGAFAARLWWLLRWMGHDRVAVLDGGIAQWTASGHPLQPGPDPRAQGVRSVSSPPGELPAALPIVLQHDQWVSLEVVEDNLTRPQYLVVDARAPDRFRGENETLDRVGGHIPGAVNRFFRNNLAADGSFKPAQQLRHEFDALLNGRSPATVISQCGSGVTACHNLLAMEIAGLKGAKLYPGSWSEWSSDPKRPVAR